MCDYHSVINPSSTVCVSITDPGMTQNTETSVHSDRGHYINADDDDLDMPDFAAMIVYFEGPKRI